MSKHRRNRPSEEGVPTRRKIIGVAVVAAALIVGAPTANSAQNNRGQTLRFTVPPPLPGDQKRIDIPPRGLSLGDRIVGAVSLKRHGHLFGRALTDCTINDKTFAGQQCTLDLVLRNGLITAKTAGLDRPLPHQTPSSNDVLHRRGRHDYDHPRYTGGHVRRSSAELKKEESVTAI